MNVEETWTPIQIGRTIVSRTTKIFVRITMQFRSIIAVVFVVCLVVITFVSNAVEGGRILQNNNQNNHHPSGNNVFAQRLKRRASNAYRRQKRSIDPSLPADLANNGVQSQTEYSEARVYDVKTSQTDDQVSTFTDQAAQSNPLNALYTGQLAQSTDQAAQRNPLIALYTDQLIQPTDQLAQPAGQSGRISVGSQNFQQSPLLDIQSPEDSAPLQALVVQPQRVSDSSSLFPAELSRNSKQDSTPDVVWTENTDSLPQNRAQWATGSIQPQQYLGQFQQNDDPNSALNALNSMGYRKG